jgi:SAM-dependent methyltransferase
MQSLTEKKLISSISEEVGKFNRRGIQPTIINIGAGKSLVIEKHLDYSGAGYMEDRLDTADCNVVYGKFRKAYISSVEKMEDIQDGVYDLGFANYVLEHVSDLRRASREIFRILKNNGLIVITVPNVRAPEFILSKFSPLWFHQFVRGKSESMLAHETFYSYNNIQELIELFENAGFVAEEVSCYPSTYCYLHKFPIINFFSRVYDRLVKKINAKFLMGNVCLKFKKP